MLPRLENYEAVCRSFTWQIPSHFNIGVDICDKWAADTTRLALIHEQRDGSATRYTFADIRRRSNQAANLFVIRGLRAGDRVGILLPQGPETAIAHVAAYKAGAIVVPLFTLFGRDALRFRLKDAGIKVLITDTRSTGKLEQIRADISDLETVFCIDGPARGGEDFHAALGSMSEDFQPVQTRADDPALIIYTSGTTGPPKGALHAHRTLLGHLPGVEMSHNFLGEAGDLMWTPADWAWIGA